MNEILLEMLGVLIEYIETAGGINERQYATYQGEDYELKLTLDFKLKETEHE